jgi:glycosyltransferase involved in cell wall biosynthesis
MERQGPRAPRKDRAVRTLSIVTPCFNEEAGIKACYEAVRHVMAEKLPGYAYEHIFIDNASPDRTVPVLREIAAGDPRVKVIVNARNFGPARSPFHGILQARGDAVIPVLADLQTPPAIIPEMVGAWEAGYKVVIAVKRTSAERDGPLKLMRSLFYRLIKSVSQVEQIPHFIGYGLYDRTFVEVLRGLNEPEPYFRGLVSEIGFDRLVIPYDQPGRLHGQSSYRFFQYVDYALLGLSSYSRAPLRLMTLTGFCIAALSFLIGVAYLIAKLLFWYSLPVGTAPILIAIFFLGAVQLFAIGVLGEYVGLVLTYSRRFPHVIEKERINYD